MSKTRVLSLAAAGALTMLSGTAFATSDPYIGPKSGFVMAAAQAGPNCVSYFLVPDGGGEKIQYAFNTSDQTNGADGRLLVMNNAALAHAANPALGHVEIKQAQDSNYDPEFNGVPCQTAPLFEGGPTTINKLPAPFVISPK